MLQPSTTLRPGPPALLVEQANAGPTRERMMLFENRRMVLEDDWRHVVWARMQRYRYDQEVFNAVAARVKRSSNVADKVIRKVALGYKTPPRRTIEGASEETRKAFERLVIGQAGLNVHPQRWERLVWGMNVVITVPVVYRAPGQPFQRRLAYEVLLGSNTEVVTREDSPSAEPIASITSIVRRGTSQLWGDTHWVYLDDKAWTTYDSKGNVVSRAPHNAGVWPGTVWRREYSSDWWCTQVGAGLFEATEEVAHINARMDWIRQGQDHKRELLFSEELKSINEQVSGADGPTEIPVNPNEARFQVEDASVPIDQHLRHIIHHARDGADSLGVDPDLLDFQEGAEGIEPIVAAQKHDHMQALRQATIPHFRRAEKDSAWKTALVLRGAGHPLRSLLKPSVIKESFAAQWSELEFVDHPETQLRITEQQINLGLGSRVDAYMARHPELTREEAKEQVLRNLEEEAELGDILAERNMPRLVEDRAADIPELQGRIGGIRSGMTRSNDDAGNSERSNGNRPRRARGTGT